MIKLNEDGAYFRWFRENQETKYKAPRNSMINDVETLRRKPRVSSESHRI